MTSPFWPRLRAPLRKPTHNSNANNGPRLETLEDRTAPAVLVNYGGPGTSLTLSETTPGASKVTVSRTTNATGAVLRIDLDKGSFAANSTASATGLTWSKPGSPATSTSVFIAVNSAGSIKSLTTSLTGDTLTFGPIADLAGAIGNINAAASTIDVIGAIDLTANASAWVSLTGAQRVRMFSPSSITTKNGDIRFQANQATTAGLAGNFSGIELNDAVLKTTGSGNISLVGRGGRDAATSYHIGVTLAGATQVISAGTGTISIVGLGGEGAGANYGVLTQDTSLITSVNGAISVTGTGGKGTGDFSIGVLMLGGQMKSTGTAPITVTGTGGQGAGSNVGVELTGSTTLITSAKGAISVTGTGGVGTDLNSGVLVQGGAAITSTGTGAGAAAINITGTGGQGTKGNYGVALDTTPSQVTAVDGQITIKGTGGKGTLDFNHGVSVLRGGSITSTGTGAGATPIVITATAGTGTGSNVGYYTDGTALVRTATGKVMVNGSTPSTDDLPGPTPSERAAALAGLNAQERFVQLMYLNELGRAGSRPELAAWVSTMTASPDTAQGAGQRNAVAAGISGSFEARHRVVKGWYSRYLGRQANGTEETGWVNALMGGTTDTQALGAILASPEYVSRSQTITPAATGSTEERFVQGLYQSVLKRSASTAEVAGWSGAIARGLGRNQVALAFLGSSEYRAGQIMGYYGTLLRRLPATSGPGEGAYITSLVASNVDLRAVRMGILNSFEYYSNGA